MRADQNGVLGVYFFRRPVTATVYYRADENAVSERLIRPPTAFCRKTTRPRCPEIGPSKAHDRCETARRNFGIHRDVITRGSGDCV